RLIGLAEAEPARPSPSLLDLLKRAPHEQSPLITRVAARHGAPDNDAVRGAAVAKVKAHYDELVADGFRVEAVEALAWPEDHADPILPITRAMLKEAIPGSARGMLVGIAAAVGRLGPSAAPLLVEPPEYAAILSPANLAGERLQAVAMALYDAAPDH